MVTTDPTAATSDPRYQKRVAFMQHLFAYSFYDSPILQEQFLAEYPEMPTVITQLSEIDETIQKFAPERPLSQINKVDLAILRSIMFEWKTAETPKKVLIDQGVELAKEFGTESSPRFVNGVLAQLLI